LRPNWSRTVDPPAELSRPPALLGSELLQHLGGDPLALPDQTEQDVFGADVIVTELQRLAQAELEDLLRPGRERYVAGRGLLALADDLHHLFADGGEIDVEALQRLSGYPLALVQQAEKDVLGADVVVVQKTRLFLSQDDYPAGTICEALKHS
jgi:hypothetical protein